MRTAPCELLVGFPTRSFIYEHPVAPIINLLENHLQMFNNRDLETVLRLGRRDDAISF